MLQTLAAWAKSVVMPPTKKNPAGAVGCSRERARQWARDGRLPVQRPAPGVYLVESGTPRPDPLQPYGRGIQRKKQIKKQLAHPQFWIRQPNS